MKEKAREGKTVSYKSVKTAEPAVLREVMAAPGIGPIISVRAAKAHLSALLELVARGQEITITSDGEPKALLSPASKREKRKVFTGTWEHLKKMPRWRGGATAEEIVREDRDGRGW
jgi:prevent-host-death family protein